MKPASLIDFHKWLIMQERSLCRGDTVEVELERLKDYKEYILSLDPNHDFRSAFSHWGIHRHS